MHATTTRSTAIKDDVEAIVVLSVTTSVCAGISISYMALAMCVCVVSWGWGAAVRTTLVSYTSRCSCHE
eukprot:jgi/Chrzof1/2880/Cz12g02180.t1